MSDVDLRVVSADPLNAETKLELVNGSITPAGRHYVRTHFAVPQAPDRIAIDGRVTRPSSITLDEIKTLAPRDLVVTLECAGNGRRFLEPAVPGEQWDLGAVGTAEWRGVPLGALLDRAAPRDDAVEVLFRGADEGTPKDVGHVIAYERALPIDVARRDDTIVAFAMNGEPIPALHGGPLRLVVAGWYGMASVKWLSRITLLDRAFVGFYQTDRYVIDGRPLREIAPRAVITAPRDGARVSAGALAVSGYAWSGTGPVASVDVSVGPPGATRRWRRADLERARSPHAWQRFSIDVAHAGGDVELVARATDAAGNVQPLEPRWNALGYANNAARAVTIRG